MQACLFFSVQCPDTAPFVAELQRLGITYESVDILLNLANFKRFLRLRDKHPAFDTAKAQGFAGIPALVYGETVILDISQLAHIKTP